MNLTKTFVVGAGASAEFGLPTAGALVSNIESICNLKSDDFSRRQSGDPLLWEAFHFMQRPDRRQWNPSHLAKVASKVRQNMGLAPSIDNFLDSRRGEEGWAEVGKLAIARAILNAERSSKLWFDSNNAYSRPSFAQFPANWLTELFRILVAQKGREEFCSALSSCRFITFNYDRVIEHFFHQAIRSYFDLSEGQADDICRSNLKILHVYGWLGEINCSKARDFGRNDDVNYLISASENIKTFTEGVVDTNQIDIAKEWINDAKTLLFLGFGLLPLNLRVFSPRHGAWYSKGRLMGTAKGMSQDNLGIALNVIRHEWYGGRDYAFEFEDVTCSELIWRHSMYLAEQA